jgi:hypothetical protein
MFSIGGEGHGAFDVKVPGPCPRKLKCSHLAWMIALSAHSENPKGMMAQVDIFCPEHKRGATYILVSDLGWGIGQPTLEKTTHRRIVA